MLSDCTVKAFKIWLFINFHLEVGFSIPQPELQRLRSHGLLLEDDQTLGVYATGPCRAGTRCLVIIEGAMHIPTCRVIQHSFVYCFLVKGRF